VAVLLQTLRPPGDLGDQIDATYAERAGLSDGTLRCPIIAVLLEDFTAPYIAIEFLRFFARVSWYFLGPGPADPQAWIQWRVNAGTFISSDTVFPLGGVGVYSQIDGAIASDPNITTNPSGLPWSLADVNGLQMRGSFFIDSSGTGEITNVQVSEVWAEVWGTPPPTATPKIRGAGVVNRIRASGEVGSKISGAGSVNKLRGGGMLSSKRTVAGVVNKVRAVGVVRVTED